MAVNTRVTFLIKSASGNFHEPYTNDPAPAFDSGPKLGDGASYVFVFSQPGTFTILCGYHNDMRATVVVTP
jgi:plastocyanin